METYVERIAKMIAIKIEIPLSEWEGKCSLIAELILTNKFTEGKRVRGHYWGEVSETSIFYDRAIIPHEWIELKDGRIYDPTRWCFENVMPYIFIGENNGEYDRGGNKIRQDNFNRKPEIKENEVLINLKLDPVTWGFAREHLNINTRRLSKNQIFWLANLSVEHLGPLTKPIYTALEVAGYKAAIPMDNYKWVIGG